MRRLIDKNIILLLIPLAILGGIAYMSTRPGGISRDGTGEIVAEWSSESIYDVRTVENTEVIENGNYAIFTSKKPSLKENRVVEETVVKNMKTGIINVLKYETGDIIDYSYSEEAGKIGFLSDESGTTQVYSGKIDGGEFRDIEMLSNSETGVVRWKWSEDGTKVAYTERGKEDEELGRNRVGELESHTLVVVDEEKKNTKIVDGGIYIGSFDWSPDGNSLSYSYYELKGDGRDIDSSVVEKSMEIREIDIATKETRAVSETPGAETPVYSNDGKHIAYLDYRDRGLSKDIVVYSRENGERVILNASENANPSIVAFESGGKILFSDAEGIATNLYSLDISGQREAEKIISSGSKNPDYKLSDSRETLTYTDESRDTAPESWLYELESGEKEQITEENVRLSDKNKINSEAVSWNTEDEVEVEGLLIYPEGYSEGEKYPLLVELGEQIGSRFTDNYPNAGHNKYPEAILSENGYMILKINGRGSDGYGADYREVPVGEFGDVVSSDAIAGVDYMLDRGIVDESNIGILGWGYGSHGATTAMSRTDVFKTSVLGSPIFDIESLLKATDRYEEAIDHLQSPREAGAEAINAIDGVDSSVLIVHGADDRRIPYSEGLGYYNALIRTGKIAEMSLYESGGHMLDSPKQKKSYIDETLKWLEERLK